MKRTDSESRLLAPLTANIIRYGAALCAAAWAVTLVSGFSLRTLAGFGMGYVFMCFSMIYLARTCERAVSLDSGRAKRLMKQCYFLRYIGLFAVCAFAMLSGAVNVVGVLVPQFFPRIILTIGQFLERRERTHE